MSDDLNAYPGLLMAAAERLDHTVDTTLSSYGRDYRLTARLDAVHGLMAAARSSELLRIDSTDPGTPSPETLNVNACRMIADYYGEHSEHHPAAAAWLDAWETYQVELTYCLLDLCGDVRTYGLTTRLSTYGLAAARSA